MSNEQTYQNFLAANATPRKLKTYSKTHINFSANDYLGLSQHPLLLKRSQEYTQHWGVGSTASRLVTGNLSIYTELETKLAAALNKPEALIMGAGYQTNISVLEALLDKRVLGETPLIFADKYTHISMLATTQHLGKLHRFQHQDFTHLKILLEKYHNSTQPKFIIVESLYSMDGDKTDLQQLSIIAKTYNAFLYVDDAHAVGVYGQNGFGLAPKFASNVNVIMGTFSKGLGSFGGYIGCSETVKNYLVNKCRGLIYSTGLSPAVLGAISAAIEIVPSLIAERTRVLSYAKMLREFLQNNGWDVGVGDSHIVPWIIGDEETALNISAELEKKGILAVAIRAPTVPVGKSRIRFCLSASHTEKDIETLLNAITNTRDLTQSS